MKRIALLLCFVCATVYAKDVQLSENEILKLKNINLRKTIAQKEYIDKLAPIAKEEKDLIESIEKKYRIKLSDYNMPTVEGLMTLKIEKEVKANDEKK